MQHSSDNRHHYTIDASKPWHLGWWADQLGLSEEELVSVLLVVGTDSQSVAEYVKQLRTRARTVELS